MTDPLVKCVEPQAWELELERALAQASPQEVLKIMWKIKGWLRGFCITCGEYSYSDRGHFGCNCSDRGDWVE